ncbi:helix-turn-helix domain-containing protein [Streptomyces sp. NPDC048297]|uniref:helix-turn-helix domain-containing protein n=1 Tax=Streptomyces sp. NPDC048297 TaxID=3365531 RepID=UPI00371CF527
MDTENPSAPSRVQSAVGAKKHPIQRPRAGGLIHENSRHTANFTVIGNHLAQHPTLSGLAIGLGVYIQSLPAGARVDIKTLAVRFPEGAIRVARALRELEAEGYLRREPERGPDGRIITRTTSCNQPGRPEDDHPPPTGAAPSRKKQAPRRELPPVPRPACPAPALIRRATDLLAGLYREDRRLLLSERDTEHLAPGVAAWLERDVSPTAVREALTTDLPAEPLCRPAALLAHRLTTRLPPPPPFRAPEPPPPVRHPFQTCESCDRAFRAPEPGHCRDCRPDLLEAA